MKPICVHCCRYYQPKKTGVYFLENMPAKAGIEPGQPEGWKPYRLWAGDLWECPGCDARLISGVGLFPIAEHYQADFDTRVQRLQADQFQVNDC